MTTAVESMATRMAAPRRRKLRLLGARKCVLRARVVAVPPQKWRKSRVACLKRKVEKFIADGWRTTAGVDKGAHWAPQEVGTAMKELLAKEVPAQKFTEPEQWNFDSPTNKMIRRETAESFCKDVSTSEAVRKSHGDRAGFDAALWQRICTELCFQAITIPEQHGGMGLGYVEPRGGTGTNGRVLLCSPFFHRLSRRERIVDRRNRSAANQTSAANC